MRDIKFRFWSKDAKEMVTWLEAMACDSEGECTIRAFLTEEPFIPMQFTGLQDRNGKDIYEGDIVQFLDAYVHGEDGDWDECACIGQIKWDNELAQFYVTKRESMDNDDFWEQVYESEVIGNIHSNPELLEATV